ncbi:ferredoxin [Streptomyces sp. NBC_00690]|uniref:ferredoxin n=1 Tax=Streptomyces sp. NBC_00690 TaxID=2975808 RepID=UPI002E2C75FA|nr:ferredoxin [Streptomyces sp. NBC_00690]
MNLTVDRALCQVTGLCAGLAPDALEMDEKGDLVILAEKPTADLLVEIRQAVRSCPVQALSLTEG